MPIADRSIFKTIHLGVLFVMAWWSMPSRQGFAMLKKVLSELDPGGQLELIVVDTDGCPDLYECQEFVGQFHGSGEVAWVLAGQVIRTSGIGYHPECFEASTRELLASAPEPKPEGIGLFISATTLPRQVSSFLSSIHGQRNTSGLTHSWFAWPPPK